MSALARPAVRRLPAAAALTGVAALATSLALGPNGTALPPLAFGGLAAALLLVALIQRTRELFRTGLGFHILLALLGLAVLAAGWSVVAAAHAEFAAVAVAVGLGGTAVTTLGVLRLAQEARSTGRTPWQALASGPTPAAQARSRFGLVAPLFLGALALLLAMRMLVLGAGVGAGRPQSGALIALALLALFTLAVGLALRGTFDGLARAAARTPSPQDPVARDERVVAAHLHDSVLQTLSLIQRNSHDPARMAQLARQQERGLRDWLAGREDPTGDTLATAVRLIAEQVEDDEAGAVIEVIAVGDAPLDATAEAMVQAGREAMRNALRHAGSPVEVYLEVEADGTRRLFIRDTGTGFDLADVAAERRGVRDAIIGRMEHAGGAAEIETGPAGTEVALTLPAARADGSTATEGRA